MQSYAFASVWAKIARVVLLFFAEESCWRRDRAWRFSRLGARLTLPLQTGVLSDSIKQVIEHSLFCEYLVTSMPTMVLLTLSQFI
jgi:hypothetical protein